jgi:hypothetical protein
MVIASISFLINDLRKKELSLKSYGSALGISSTLIGILVGITLMFKSCM